VNAGRYYNEDQRTINDAGVRHVMRLFLATFARDRVNAAPTHAPVDLAAEFEGNAGVICDEEEIERSVA
jgi:hypothetical protein